MDRRTFLKASTMSFLTCPFPIASAKDQQPLGIRIGACDWTMGYRADPNSLSFAKTVGLDGVQVDFGAASEGMLPLFDEGRQDQFLEVVEETGLPIPSLAMAELNAIPLKESPEAMEWVRKSVLVAQRMKVPVVLLAFFGKGSLSEDEEGRERVTRFLKEFAPRAEELGVIYGIESTLKVEVLERMLDQIQSSHMQVYYDVANMQAEGEDFGEAIRRLGKERICEFHAKDFQDLYGKGEIAFEKMKEAISDIDWKGAWVQIEGTQFPEGLEHGLRHNVAYLKTIFNGVGKG